MYGNTKLAIMPTLPTLSVFKNSLACTVPPSLVEFHSIDKKLHSLTL